MTSSRARRKSLLRRLKGKGSPFGLFKSPIAVASIGFCLAGCGGAWPPPPGVEEKGWRKTDTWETRRRESPWERPLNQDPTYRRLAENYQKMGELDQGVRMSGWKSTEEYRAIRFRLDKLYAGGRSLVHRLRSSGTEMTPDGQRLIESAIVNLEELLEEAVREAERFEAAEDD